MEENYENPTPENPTPENPTPENGASFETSFEEFLETLTKAVGRNLRVARTNAGVRVPELAEDLGVTVSHIYNIERGVSRPSLELMLRICYRFGLAPYALLT